MTITSTNTIKAYYDIWTSFSYGEIDINDPLYIEKIYEKASECGADLEEIDHNLDWSHISLDVRAMACALIVAGSQHRERWKLMLRMLREGEAAVGATFGAKLDDIAAGGYVNDRWWMRDELKRVYVAAVSRCVLEILRAGRVESRPQAEFYALSGSNKHSQAGSRFIFAKSMVSGMNGMEHAFLPLSIISHWGELLDGPVGGRG